MTNLPHDGWPSGPSLYAAPHNTAVHNRNNERKTWGSQGPGPGCAAAKPALFGARASRDTGAMIRLQRYRRHGTGAMRLAPVLGVFLLAACAPEARDAPPTFNAQQGEPEIATARQAVRPAARATRHMVASAHPLAAQAGLEILRAGGSAVDAAIATQLVLNVVEPQSSGIGGGGFLVHRARDGTVEAYDGRETAPASATGELFLGPDGKPLAFFDAVRGGLSVGTPGLLRLLESAHRDHGKLSWPSLFAPAIALAESGFAVTPRLAAQLAADTRLRASPEAAALFYPEGRAPRAGEHWRNPALADTFRILAARGADAFYAGEIAADIVAAVRGAARPGRLAASDLAAYSALKGQALCGPYRGWTLCGAPPPSSGPLAVLQLLAMVEARGHALPPANGAAAVHLITELQRMVFADRDAYVADPKFAEVPARRMLDPVYIRMRAQRVTLDRTLGPASPGLEANRAAVPEQAPGGTSHISVVDAAGTAVALSSSIEQQFGSGLLVRGFLLNNQLTDFAFVPERAGRKAANRVEPGKRPRSSMTPMIATDENGRFVLSIGSAGGPQIIAHVAKTILGIRDWGLDIQQAIDLPNFSNRNGATEIEANTALVPLVPELAARGHELRLTAQPGGLHAVAARAGVLWGGADPRREGVALGD